MPDASPLPPRRRLFPDDVIDALRPKGAQRLVPAGATLYRRGDPASTFYIVESGELQAQHSPGVEVRQIGAGERLGELALIDRTGARAFTVTALRDSVLLEITRDDFEAFLEQDPTTGLAALRHASGFLLDSESALLGQLQRRARELDRLLQNTQSGGLDDPLAGGPRPGDQRLEVRRAASMKTDASAAVQDLAAQLHTGADAVVVFFASPRYDLQALACALRGAFQGTVMGCTSAGEILSGHGYLEGGLVGVSLRSTELVAHPRLIQGLAGFDTQACVDLTDGLRSQLQMADDFDRSRMFGLLLIDGLSMQEEKVAALLHGGLKGVAVIGGSAGDELNFARTHVYFEGGFHSDAALFCLFETSLPFRTFRVQHFEPTSTRLVITEADGATRTVHEIDGEPAAQAYARAVGVEVSALSPQIFAANPVMLRIQGEYFVRSIQQVNPDGSLRFFCAIDNGLVLTLGRGTDLVEHLHQSLQALRSQMPELQLLLGCDCILRRLEMVQKGTLGQAGPALDIVPFVGFSTYGEQIDGVHVNQTLTGLAIGA